MIFLGPRPFGPVPRETAFSRIDRDLVDSAPYLKAISTLPVAITEVGLGPSLGAYPRFFRRHLVHYLYEDDWNMFRPIAEKFPFIVGFDNRQHRHDWLDRPGHILTDSGTTATTILTTWLEQADQALLAVQKHWPNEQLDFIRHALKDTKIPAQPTSSGLSQHCLRPNATMTNLVEGRWADDAAVHNAPEPVDLHDRETVLHRQCELAEALAAARAKAGLKARVGATLLGPAINPAIASKLESALRKTDGPISLAKGLLEGNSFLIHVDQAELLKERSEQLAQSIVTERAQERDFYDAVGWIVAAGAHEPVFRTANLPSGLYKKLDHLGSMTWSQRTIRRSVNRWERYCADLTKSVGPTVLRQLARMDRIKILSDLPLEWARVDGVPLSFLVPTSRVPFAPGNLPVRLIVDPRPPVIWQDPSDVRMLFLNGHDQDDPFGSSVTELSKLASKLGFPASEARLRRGEDLPRLLDEHKPQLVYISCHGSMTKGLGTTLDLPEGHTPLRLERLRHVPDAVVLSACRSDAVARTHGGPASNLYGSGVRAVLASYLNLTEPHASLVMQGLLIKLRSVLLGEARDAETWLELVWSTLNMRRPIDILVAASRWSERNQSNGRDPFELFQNYTELQNQANVSLQTLWTKAPARLVELARGTEFETSIRAVTRGKAFRSESCFYTHLGEPEQILLKPH